ncbi:MAG: hypothetical protein MUO62_11645 [Anaerolineales bacterium]|nr:hypothetical protein [Anaerolineales bacterium]
MLVKRGLSPKVIAWMDRGVTTPRAGSGAAIIHDLEIAFQGHTSEDVGRPCIMLLADFIVWFCIPAWRKVLPARLLMAGLWKWLKMLRPCIHSTVQLHSLLMAKDC